MFNWASHLHTPLYPDRHFLRIAPVLVHNKIADLLGDAFQKNPLISCPATSRSVPSCILFFYHFLFYFVYLAQLCVRSSTFCPCVFPYVVTVQIILPPCVCLPLSLCQIVFVSCVEHYNSFLHVQGFLWAWHCLSLIFLSSAFSLWLCLHGSTNNPCTERFLPQVEFFFFNFNTASGVMHLSLPVPANQSLPVSVIC